ncbi:hypothetical protein UFOVP70_10 [uncultured Caudovirales phage]|uniref:Uncharacterized protein n=1 Tax=uncultured Caudovirales phage TaxID=2100421 RepID=A0A6J5KZ72_9CAUD|nr:hypothetical protein UFOVP70_10 [uncultured Caudovirales phage]
MNIHISETEYLKTQVQRLSALVRAQQITIDKLEAQHTDQESVAKYSDIVSDGGLDPRNTTPPQRTEQEQQIEMLKRCLFQMQEAAKDLVEQAKSLTPPQRAFVGLTEDDKVLIKHDANFNQFMTAGEYADRVQALTEARLKDKNT